MSLPTRDTADERLSRKGLFHLSVVYVVWSTTYIAMRVGVSAKGGFPPFFLGMMRMSAGAVVLLAMARLQGHRMRPPCSEWLPLAVTGNLFWLCGNGFLLWAEQYAASGFTCLMASSAPIWAAIIELILFRKRPSVPLCASLLVGFAGIAILSASSFGIKGQAGFRVVLFLILGPLSWALGSVIQARRKTALSPQVTSGYQHVAAFIGFLAVTSAIGEPAPHPAASAWLAWGYLVIFASVITFTSFVTALRLLPISITMTYAYVNPVLALFLGWLLLAEPITARTVLGAAFVVTGVFMIFRIKVRAKG